MTRGYRLLIKSARTVHIYTTLTGLLLILFFAFTGFVLNHEDWFQLGEPTKHTVKGLVPPELLTAPEKLAVVEVLRGRWGATGAMEAFEVEPDSLKVVFKSPGRQTEATIERRSGALEVIHESRGILGRLTDLHRGKDSGAAWSLVIDATCILLLLVSTTGLTLWYSLRNRFHWGLAAMTLGLVLFATFYTLAVS